MPTSKDMISDIGLHEHVSNFTHNPLLLTAVCILYLVSGKRIPDQRADLYNRIVENLVYRRFHDPASPGREEEVEEYLMRLAFSMQDAGTRSIEAHEARQMLKEVYPAGQNETEQDYKKRIGKLFDKIEPDCGLLSRLSSGDVEFFHLTFQEFLAGKHIHNMDIDVARFLDKSWWQETVLLYAGLMNLEMKKRSNALVRRLLESEPVEEKKKFYLWLLGAKALRDFQSFKREEFNVELAANRLKSLLSPGVELSVRFEAGEIAGSLGDVRLRKDNMIKIPAGEFLRGSNVYRENEKPERKIYLDEFMIGKYPVTNQEYRRFVDAGGYENKEYWTPEGWRWREEEKIIEPEYLHDRKWNGGNFPVVGVSWYEAVAYACWLAKEMGKPYRLPTEAEWEKAARGTKGLIYPWGNEFDKNKCNYRETRLGRTSPVGIFPGGESPYGCVDMAGNVWEWCLDWFGDEYYKDSPDRSPKGPDNGSYRVVRGGSWGRDAASCRASFRYYDDPAARWLYRGFRLARSL